MAVGTSRLINLSDLHVLLSAEKVTGDGVPEGRAEGLPGCSGWHSAFSLLPGHLHGHSLSVIPLRSAKPGRLSWISPPPTLFLAVLS